MTHATQWQVEIFIDEADSRTRAEARLHTRDGEVVGVGTARCNPADANVPEIGDELAAARAFSDLAHKLLDLAANDIEGVTHRPAHLVR